MFETIEREGGNTPPQWLSDHPNPGNRVEYINAEADHLTVEPSTRRSSDAFARTQEHLKTLRPARSLADLAREQQARRPRR
jgi:predicted Zn-dependent protease